MTKHGQIGMSNSKKVNPILEINSGGIMHIPEPRLIIFLLPAPGLQAGNQTEGKGGRGGGLTDSGGNRNGCGHGDKTGQDHRLGDRGENEHGGDGGLELPAYDG